MHITPTTRDRVKHASDSDPTPKGTDIPELERVTVRLEADIADYKQSLRQAEQAAVRTAERITATFRDVHRNASQAARGPQAFGVTMRRASTLSGDKRNLSSLRSATAGSRSISQAADTLAEGPGGDTARRLANMPKQAASASSILRIGFKTLFRIVGVISDIVAFMALGSEILSKKSGGLDVVVEKQNRLVREQIRRLRKAKGLVDPLAEETEKTEKLLSQKKDRLRSFESLRELARREIEDINRGGGDTTLDLKTNLDNALSALKRAEEGIARTSENISLIQEALAAQAVARDSAGAGLSPELERCLQLLCDRLDSFGQDIPFDRASAASGDGGRFLRASFDPADSPFGGTGLDGLNQNLADAGWRVQDLSTGFVELTEAAGGYEARAAALNALLGEQSGLIGQLLTQVPELGGQFSAFLERTAEQGQVLNQVIDAVGQSFLNAFEGAIQRGESLGDVLKGLIVDLAEIALRAAGNKFLELFLGSLFGPSGPGPGGRFLSLAQGAAFGPGGRFLTLARGGAFMGAIVDTPTAFRFARGVGVMGEAGPEAVLPLTRLASGELGVKALMPRVPEAPAPAAAGPTFNIFAPGADREGLR